MILRQEALVKLIFQHSGRSKLVLLARQFKNYSSLKVGTFFGHSLERMNASKFQIFEIQVFIFSYSRISIGQISENLGFLRFKGGGGGVDILTTPVSTVNLSVQM